MSSWATVAGSWGFLAGCVVLGWYYYTKDGGRLQRLGKQQISESISDGLEELAPKTSQKKQKRKNKKAQVADKTTPVSAGDNQALTAPVALVKAAESGSQKRKPKENGKAAWTSATDTTSTVKAKGQQDDDDNNKDFAHRLNKTQTGTTLSNTSKDVQRVRTQKLSKVTGSFGPGATNGDTLHSGTSSNTGADADDDLSSANSPGLSAITSPADTTGVSDMLEPTGPGPVSLRITEPLVPVKPKQRQVKKEEAVETKKQRQNRLKREREKEANREAEAQRKILEEKQRRTAREAEGRPAKNGNGWTYDSGLPANAWSTGKSKAPPPAVTNGGLLDTTEGPSNPSTVIEKTPLPLAAEKMNGIKGTTAGWKKDLPSEEEQMRLIQEQSEESEWTTVSQVKKGKKKEQTSL